ncbi:phosphatase PAP2 family protein [Halopiger xanaduensis]|uniref:Phosphoesterase PA-phosphatase related protein n=1 Tax=Halopiger xanaduensis (strain DSM 18323 / JCM 14033 / SH-6) TaxID=797210 RepID=F8D8R7_HALXS|nr:phosphatase PAP2 family protein [Halopiger xanaduensis]AEH37977.1 phosphoesterase PA-phosphatase related protein [Halopiger xanaduensis SH-6]
MSFLVVLLELALVVVTMLVTASLAIVGPRRIVSSLGDFRWRLEICFIPLLALASVLILRWSTADAVVRLERRVFGNNITQWLFDFDRLFGPGGPVALLQSLQSPALTSYFVFAYVYGYAFLLLFPFIAYFALEETDDLADLILAFTANYAIGLCCYVLFMAYGPRNFDPLLFDGLLYDAFPRIRDLTGNVNRPTNVFPSLHTSLSMTVFFFAWQTREKYPTWVPVAGVLAISIVFATMYLGIHWFSDVVAGTLLAAVSVYIGRSYTVREATESGRRYLSDRLGSGGRTDGD